MTKHLCWALLLAMASGTAQAQTPEGMAPEDFGFAPFEIETEVGPVECFVATGRAPLDTTRSLPLVVYLQGSNYAPIFHGPEGAIRGTLFLGPWDFPDHHYAVIAKPEAPFWAERVGETPRAYHEALSLPWRVAAARAVVSDLARQPWVDRSRVAVVGHSEGADVAPWVAVDHPAVTHVASLSGGALSQMYDFVLDIRRRQRSGTVSFEEAEAEVAALHDRYRRIYAAPSASDSLWQGDHSYLRWSSFFRAPLEAYLALDIPVFVAAGTADEAVPVESADYLPLAFIQAGKENLTYRVWPVDHFYREVTTEGETISRKPDVVSALRSWLEERPATP